MGHNLSIRTRRLLARGIGPRAAHHWGAAPFLSIGIGNRAKLPTQGTGNSAFDGYSRFPGTGGNTTTFRVVTGAGSNSVVVTGTPGTNAAVVANVVTGTTVDQMARIVDADPIARPIVKVQRALGSDGTGAVANMAAAVALAGAV